MPCFQYVPDIKFRRRSLRIIEYANEIIAEYAAMGYDLTLRQLYYQFVARDLIPNLPTEYDKLGDIISNARMAGLLDWEAITDRTRNLKELSFWENPQSIVDAAARSYRIDKWADQQCRIEAWIEKDALLGVIAGVCEELEIPYISCRGYFSQSEMWVASKRIIANFRRWDQPTVILHLGDHDPSGIDMTRDITDRLAVFLAPFSMEIGEHLHIRRIALNYDQIEEFAPPPNPAKTTDSRFEEYERRYGRASWELDALDPRVLTKLIRQTARSYMDMDMWNERVKEEQLAQDTIRSIARDYDAVKNFVEDRRGA